MGSSISLSSRLMGGGGYLLKVPAIDLAEIGAGGGSIVWIDRGGGPQVGPQSAAALPGPLCYDAGGEEATVTDANLLLGYLNPESLAGGGIRLNIGKTREIFQEEVAAALGLDLLEAAYGIHEIANARMIRAVRSVSSERGRDPGDFVMIAFGGSGPVHAPAMARQLGVGKVIVPRSPGLFSAFGLLWSDIACHRSRTILARTDEINDEDLVREFRSLESAAKGELGSEEADIKVVWSADLRYVGQSFELNVDLAEETLEKFALFLRERFEEEHERTYGHKAESDPVEIVNLRVTASLARKNEEGMGEWENGGMRESRTPERDAYFGPDFGVIKTAIIGREALGSAPTEGALIVEEYDATTVVPPGCSASLDKWGNIVIKVQLKL